MLCIVLGLLFSRVSPCLCGPLLHFSVPQFGLSRFVFGKRCSGVSSSPGVGEFMSKKKLFLAFLYAFSTSLGYLLLRGVSCGVPPV